MTRMIGIDIGTYSIKVARVDVQARGYQLANFREFVLNQDPNADRQIQTIEILRKIASEFNSDDCRYVVALPQKSVSLRNKAFPFRERLKILKSVPFELEDDIPLDQDEAIFDAKITRLTADGADVLACASPRDNVGSLLSLVQECGIDPEIITVEGFAYANTIEDWMAPLAPPPPQASLALEQSQVYNTNATVYLHIGHSSTLVSLYQQGALLAVRPILWGGRDIADQLSRKYQVPFLEAIKVLQTKGFILINDQGHTRDELAFSQTITGSVDHLLRELRLVLIDLKTEFNVQLDQVLMSGGVALLPHLGPYMTQGLELPVNLHNHLSRYSTGLLDASKSTPAISNIAFGLAFEGMRKPRNPAVNLRKDEFGKQSKTLQLIWEKWKHAAQVAAAAFVVFFVYSVLRDSATESLSQAAEDNLKAQAKNVAQMRGPRTSESAIRKFVNDRQKEIKARETLKELQGLTSAMDILKRLAELAPQRDQVQVDIRHLSVQKDLLTIEGEVAKAAQIDLLKKAWSSVARDGQVQSTPASIQVQAPRAAFSFKIKLLRWVKGAP